MRGWVCEGQALRGVSGRQKTLRGACGPLSSLPRKGRLDDEDCSRAERGAEALQRAGLPVPPQGVPGGMGQFPRASRQPEAHASGNHFPALCLL